MRSLSGLRLEFTINSSERRSQAASWMPEIRGPVKPPTAMSSVTKPTVLLWPSRSPCAVRFGR